MKKILLSIIFVLSVFTAFADKDVRFHMKNGEVKSIAQERVDSIFFDDAEQYIFIAFDGDRKEQLAITDVDSIKYSVLPQMVEVTYSGSMATVLNPFAFDSVSVSIDGAKVTVTSQTTKEIDYQLHGASDNGCFKIYGSRKYNLYLNGVSLTNTNGAAINSQCKKRARMFVNDGTVNTLADAAKYSTVSGEDEKGTIFSEGQIIFEGTGKLIVNGLYKHAICSDDYVEFRGATVEVANAAGDAVHVNDSVIVKGGNLVLNSQGDGIDCDGYVKLLSGKVDISTAGEDVKGVKAVKDIVVDGAELSVLVSGDASKGIKSGCNFSLLSGIVNIESTGNTIVLGGDPSYATCIKCDSTVTISGGAATLKATGIAGRGISADGDVAVTDGTTTIVCCGNSETYDPTYDEILGGEDEEEPKSYVVYVSVPTSTTSNRPGGTSSSAWKSVYLYNGSNTLVATLINKVVINNTTFYYYDFGSEQTGTYYFKSDNYTSGRTTYTIQSSSFTGLSSDTYYQIASNYSTLGSTRTYSITDVTGSYAGGSTASSTEDSYAAAGIKCDNNFTLSGGNHTITMSGSESKGIKVEGTALFDGGELTINTSGVAKVVAYDPSYCTAIKCDGALTINGGDIDITATGQGGMGISADGVLTMNDGMVDITISGAGSSYTATTGTDYYSTKCLKGDVAVNLFGGTLNCLAKGNGSKAIVASGELTIGREGAANDLLTITAVTQGSSLGSTSGGGGGGLPGGMGGGMNSGFNAAPKAIKGAANVYVNSGNVYAETKNDGGEGLESKATLTINGGVIGCSTYDDGINAKSALVINGGYIYSHATNNDGIDSNGTITVNGGIALSSGSSAPEEGFDCDQNQFVINGGIMIGTGGATSNPTSASQPYSAVSLVSVTSGKYIAVKNSSGTVLFSYKCPNTVSSATVLLSSPEFTKTSHTLMYGVTSVSGATETLFDGVYSVGGTLSGGSSKTFTPQTK